MVTPREFDVVVIGAGPAGEVCAGRLGAAGLEVAVVERRLVGGECSFYGCMPSKALLRPAELLAEAARVPGVREAINGNLDPTAVLARRDDVIHGLDDSEMIPWLDERNVTVVRGEARLTGERRVEVDGNELRARRAVVIAVGTEAFVPPIPGLREAHPWTNREATTTSVVPRHLVVLGGGVIGVELAQAYRSLGSEVTMVEANERLISREEPFASLFVAEALAEAGVTLRTGVRAASVERDESAVRVTLEDDSVVTGDELLVAIGRRPATSGVGLDQFGLEEGHYIAVDDQLRAAGQSWLYAIGDANGIALLTHMAKYQARVAADVILGADARLRGEGADAPRVVFTDPQVAAVGHTLASAVEAGLNVRTVEVDPGANAGGSFVGRGTPGLCRLIVDEDAKVVVGATFVGFEVAESLHAATIAITARVALADLWHAVPCFPTRSELWLRLLETYGL
jgi:pyruvate/2-oxoglutarate dehydrogenase complex dihydrolipoamide dehydrogenase (E3) component